jgi:hypothetical protein
MNKIELVALDLDGTLFDNHSRISPLNFETIHRISQKGVHVVISTGRPYSGLPFDQIKDSGITYAINTNGSSIYEIASGQCLNEEAMDETIILPILKFLLTRDIHMDAFIGGNAYSPLQCLPAARKLDIPASVKEYIIHSRTRVDDLAEYIHKNQLQVQKMTLNFFPDGHGGYHDREVVARFLESIPDIDTVCGGYHNLEFTRSGINKGVGLVKLAEILGVDPANTLAIGDSENDLAILKTADIGVAMGNATAQIKEQADYITASNEEDGVAKAIHHFILHEEV